jgi:hypothetical protein
MFLDVPMLWDLGKESLYIFARGVVIIGVPSEK